MPMDQGRTQFTLILGFERQGTEYSTYLYRLLCKYLGTQIQNMGTLLCTFSSLGVSNVWETRRCEGIHRRNSQLAASRERQKGRLDMGQLVLAINPFISLK